MKLQQLNATGFPSIAKKDFDLEEIKKLRDAAEGKVKDHYETIIDFVTAGADKFVRRDYVDNLKFWLNDSSVRDDVLKYVSVKVKDALGFKSIR